ncbi:MAG TPA: Ig-like domain repeat protein, partial [Pyrinomonadaceae bacterium]|nr:Ig-like domain repeat protein [Pyrinomonadaceae bacterium]
TNVTGNVISHSVLGLANVTTTIANNVIVANHTAGVGGALGISTGAGKTFSTNDTASLTISITGNNVSQTDANGILARAVEAKPTMNITVKNNTVAAPLSGVRPGIRVDSGDSASNSTVCLDMQSNTSAGSGGTNGLGLRRQTTNTNVYGVEGMAATSSPGVESYVNGLNPAGNGTLLISGTTGFSNCSAAPDQALSGNAPLAADSSPKTQQTLSGAASEQMRAVVDEDPVRPPDREMILNPAPEGSTSSLKFSAPFIAPLVTPAAPEADHASVETLTGATVEAAAQIEAARVEAAQTETAQIETARTETAQVETAQTATARARVWSDMPAGSESAAAEVRRDNGANAAEDVSAQGGATFVNASYVRGGSKRAETPAGDAVAANAAARPSADTGEVRPSADADDNGAAVYAHMANALLAVAFFSGEIVTVSGKNNNGFTLPVGRTVTVTFQATLNNPPNFASFSATQKVSAQGTLSGAFTGNPLLTDDTSVGGANDPTQTAVDYFNSTSTITGASPSNSTNTGQPVTFTASVAFSGAGSPAPAGGTLPGGTATFKDNGSDIAGCVGVTVTSGAAQCTTSALATGVHNNITVAYNGDGNFDPSTSAAFTQTVTQSGTTVTVTSSLNPSLVTQNVTFTATVASTGGNAGPPTGTVTFKDGASTISCTGGSQTLSGGVATCQIATLTAGNHSITAVYGGDSNFTGNTGTLTGNPQVVDKS